MPAPNVERVVPCPTCRQPAVYAERNRWRPFCSARCRGIDLGAWANEDYRVPAAPPAEAGDDDRPAPPRD
ncbi:MAG: DNA gyrase inhibitor YacG [Rubrivivax sp.]|jgi:hypothetical protein|nr:DNA gyrase inhibitor YacG [Rubrivivax sp.]